MSEGVTGETLKHPVRTDSSLVGAGPDRPQMPHQLSPAIPPGPHVRLSELAIDPYPILARLRETTPVAWVEETQMWFVTRRADVLSVLRDPSTYRTDSPRSTIRDTFGTQMLSAEGDLHRRYK